MWNKLKQRFATLETLEGQTYFWIGGALLVSFFLGIPQVVAGLIPIAAVALIALGAYKTLVKRG